MGVLDISKAVTHVHTCMCWHAVEDYTQMHVHTHTHCLTHHTIHMYIHTYMHVRMYV